MQVSKWGNSLAIRLPLSVVKALELQEGDNIEVFVADQRTFHIKIKKELDRPLLLERLRQFRGKLPPDFIFDRNDANARP